MLLIILMTSPVPNFHLLLKMCSAEPCETVLFIGPKWTNTGNSTWLGLAPAPRTVLVPCVHGWTN